MEYKKNHKIKLTKFGKKFFAFTIVLIIGISVLCLNNSNRNLKEETNNYLVEINYPKVNNKDLLVYIAGSLPDIFSGIYATQGLSVLRNSTTFKLNISY